MEVEELKRKLEKRYNGRVAVEDSGYRRVFVAVIPVFEGDGPRLIVVGEINNNRGVNEFDILKA